MLDTLQEQKDWCIAQHTEINHTYDSYLPYRFHLEMVASVARRFEYLFVEENIKGINRRLVFDYDIPPSCYGHDLLEDTHVSYNDVVDNLGGIAADIIYALTNEKGKTRKERANDKYYQGIRDTEGAVFVKLCDRIANVEYSIMTRESIGICGKLKMYKDENVEFIRQLGYENNRSNQPLKEMFEHLINLFQQ